MNEELQPCAVGEGDMHCTESADRAYCCSQSPDKVDDNWELLAPAMEQDLLSLGGQERGASIEAMLAEETDTQVPSNFLSLQPLIGAQHRELLVSWITTAATCLNLGGFTSALAVNLLDRFIASHEVQEGEQWALQLAAVACLSIASKVEEGTLPVNVAHLQVAAPWDPFEARHIKRMELVVLARLDWRIFALTPASFLDPLLLAAASASGGGPSNLQRVRGQALSLVCRTLPDKRHLVFRPSTIAAAAILVAARSSCGEETLRAMDAHFNSLTSQVGDCTAALMKDFGRELVPSANAPCDSMVPDWSGAGEAPAHARQGGGPAPTSILQRDAALPQLSALSAGCSLVQDSCHCEARSWDAAAC